MAEPVRNPDTGGRSLADILREAGIENPTRTGRRRRWDDMDDTGIRQRRAAEAAEAARESAGAPSAYGRRAGDLPLDRPEIDRSSGMPRVRDERFRRLQPPDSRPLDERLRDGPPPDRRDREDRPREDPQREVRQREVRQREVRQREDRQREDRQREDRQREDRQREDRQREDRQRDQRLRRDPAVDGAREAARNPAGDAPARDPLRDTGRRTSARPEPPRAPAGDPSTAAIPGLRPSRTPSVPVATSATAAGTPAPGTAAAPAEGRLRERRGPHRAPDGARGSSDTGRIPPTERAERADGAAGTEGEAPPREGALAWARFAGELVIAAAVGVGVYFAFTVLWEMAPHVAALASPLVVTGLVLGVSTWRQRSGRGQLGARLLGVLVFAGTVLTILPAAGLLSG